MFDREAVFQKAEESFPTSRQIREDVANEFEKLRSDLLERTARELTPDQIKSGLSTSVPDLLRVKFRLLLDTLLNYLMKDAGAILEPASTDLKNSFYGEDFRSRIGSLFEYEPESLEFGYQDITPYLSHGRWVFPTLGVLPTILPTVKLWPSFLTPGGHLTKGVIILAGIAAGYACHMRLAKEQERSKASLRNEVLSYVDSARPKVLQCLEEDVRLGFVDDFMKFCNKQGFQF
jgi:hypothetical protein